MAIQIDEKDVKSGLMGLVMALVEIIKESLKHQAIRRMEGGSLRPDEVERLGKALKELDAAVEKIEEEQGLSETVRSIRRGLDQVVQDLTAKSINGRNHS